ncbi:MAG: ATP-binding protein [Chloroflexota bacterium]
MNLDELRERTSQGKNLHTEFKLWPINTNRFAETLVAFANTDGGQLLLGVSDTGTLAGVEDTDAVMRTVDNVAYNNCQPPLTIVQEALRFDGEQAVVIVNIPQGDQRPYSTNTGKYSIRTTSGRRLASQQELLRLFQRSRSIYYDETPFLRTSLNDLYQRDIEHFFQQSQGYSLE